MSEQFKDALRFALIQFFIITVCVMFVISLVNTVFGNFGSIISADFPWIMMLTGLLTSLPSFLLYFRDEPTKKQFYFRAALHFCCIEAIVLFEGHLLGWFGNISGCLIVASMVLGVYLLVWFFSALLQKSTAKNINDALKEFNSDE